MGYLLTGKLQIEFWKKEPDVSHQLQQPDVVHPLQEPDNWDPLIKKGQN
jgi:hypothetical protein